MTYASINMNCNDMFVQHANVAFSNMQYALASTSQIDSVNKTWFRLSKAQRWQIVGMPSDVLSGKRFWASIGLPCICQYTIGRFVRNHASRDVTALDIALLRSVHSQPVRLILSRFHDMSVHQNLQEQKQKRRPCDASNVLYWQITICNTIYSSTNIWVILPDT